MTSNERLLRAAKELSKVLPKGRGLETYHACAELVALREAIDASAHETPDDLREVGTLVDIGGVHTVNWHESRATMAVGTKLYASAPSVNGSSNAEVK